MSNSTVNDISEMAGLLEVMGQLVYDEPSSAVLDTYTDGLFAQVPEQLTEDPDAVQGFLLMEGWLRQYREGDREELCGDLQREWLRLFVGVGEPQVPSWANYYSDFEQRVLGRESLEVRAAYRKAGLEPANLNREPDDNLGLMLQFLAVLASHEAVANSDDKAEKFRDEQASFLRKHVLPWIARWEYEVEKHAETTFYQGMGKALSGIVRCYAHRFGFIQTESGAYQMRKDVLR